MKILSIGAVLMDQIALVDRFPNPDDEVFVPRLQLMPGGSAANFAVFCARLGEGAGFIGKVGRDALGDTLIADLRKEGVNADAMPRTDIPTGTVFVAVRRDGQRVMFAYSGAANDLREGDISLSYIGNYDHLHIADLENLRALEYTAARFREAGKTISVNTGALIAEKGPSARKLVEMADILICSEDEAKMMSGTAAAEDSLRVLMSLGPKLVVVTRGEHPPVASDGKKTYSAKTFKVNPIDTTGAGDSFSAGFISEYLRTKNVEKSLRFANAVAATVIQSPGARGGLKDRAQVEKML